MLDTEVQLNPAVFHQLKNSGPFQALIDWFALDENAQLPRLFTWFANGQTAAEGNDAFTHSWSNTPGYMFPPFSLIPRIIHPKNSPRRRQDPFRPSTLARCPVVPVTSGDHPYAKINPSVSGRPPLPIKPRPTPSDDGLGAASLMARWGITDQPMWTTIEASLAPSTQRAYLATFSSFLQYIRNVNRNMETVQLVDVLSFLQEYVDKRRAQSHAALFHFFLLYQ